MTASLAERADSNYFHSWRVRGNAAGGEVVERDGVLLVSSALPVAFFNHAFIMRRLDDADAGVAAAVAFFEERKLPFMIRMREGVDSRIEEACSRVGLPFSDVVPGLVMAPIGRIPALPQALEIRPVMDDETLQDHRDVAAAAFGLPGPMAARFIGRQLIDVPGAEFYVGYVDGKAIASSALIASDGVSGVYNVGCVPEARKRGFGEAMTWHPVRRGQTMGCDIASLQTSEMGRPIYERMGFHLKAPYLTFVRPL